MFDVFLQHDNSQAPPAGTVAVSLQKSHVMHAAATAGLPLV